MPKPDHFYQTEWTQRRLMLERSRARGHVLMVRSGHRIHVSAPKDMTFREGALKLGGQYLPRSGQWSFPSVARLQLAALVREVYGDQVPIPAWVES